MSPTDAAVREALREVYDPCSVSAGCPISLEEMGLVTSVEIGSDGAVAVRLRVTAPGCTFGAFFSIQAKERIAALPGVGEVTIELVEDWTWSEADISPDALARLTESRAQLKSSLAHLAQHARS